MTLIRTAAAFIGALALTQTISAVQAETLRLSHNTGDTTTWHKGSERFGELIAEGSNGELDLRIFPNAQLTGGDQMKQAEGRALRIALVMATWDRASATM